MATAPALRLMLEELIALPSVSSVNSDFDQGNRQVADRLADWLEGLGFATDLRAVPGHPDKVNLVATLGRGHDGLVLAGHMDTVPCNAELWSSDPFALSERDGRLYGLGICDMKSFLALAIEAARGLRAADLRRPLVIVATADEESSMAGAKALADAGQPIGRHAIIGEPTGLRPIHAHKGMLLEAVRIDGRSGHASDPRLGVNALEAMARVLPELLDWRDDLRREPRDERFSVPYTTLNLGHLRAGDNPNRICANAEIQIDLRPLPSVSADDLRQELSWRVERVLTEYPGRVTTYSLFPGQEPMETPADAPIVAAAREFTGHTPGAVSFGTDGPFFRALGMDVVVLGPGDIEVAHQPDESLALACLDPTVTLLRRFIQRFCVERVD